MDTSPHLPSDPQPDPGRSRRPQRAAGVRRTRLVALLAAAALVGAACGGSDEASWAPSMPEPAPSPGAPGMPGMDAPDFAPSPGGEYPGEYDDGRTVGGDLPDAGRAVVRNARVEIIVDDGAAAFDAAEALAVALGGSVASSNRSRGEDGTVNGGLVLRVPSDRLDELVDGLDALARSVPMRSIDELDVTMQLSDIDAQLRNLRAFEDELRELLNEVRRREGTVDGLVAVADTLRRVRTEIDVIEARRVQLADQVALSTVDLWIVQARSTTPVVGTWDLPSVVRDALAATVRLGQLAVEGIVWFLVTGLPALLVLLAAAAGLRAVRARRRSRQRSATPAE